MAWKTLARTMCIAAALIGAAGSAAEAQDGDWAGIWDTRWLDGGARLTLRQDGDRVTGQYPLYGGTLEGTVDGRRLVGTWQEPNDSGRLEFVLSADGQSFMGRFGQEAWWTGARITPETVKAETNVSQASPADVLHAFLVIADAVDNGQLEYLDDLLGLLAFDGAPIDRRDQLREVDLLAAVIDQFEFQLEDIRQQTSAAGERAVVTLSRFDGQTFELAFAQQDGAWFLAAPPVETLETRLADLLERSGGRLPPDNHIFRLKTPRDTMEAFIDSMRVGPGGLDTAVAALDLSELSPVGREREAVLLAEYLEQVLARLGEVVYQEVPNDPDSRTPYVHFTHPSGDIVIAPMDAGDEGVQWKFTPETLRSVRQLFTATEDLPPASVVLPLYRPAQATFFRIRSALGEVSPGLLRPLGPLETWQWAAMVAAFLFALVATLTISFLIGRLVGLVLGERADGEAGGVSRSRAAQWGVRLIVFGLISYGGLLLLGLPDNFAGAVLAVAVVAMIAGAIPIEFWLVDAVRAMLDRAGLISQRGDILASLLVGVLKVAIVLGNFLLLAEALNIPYGAALAGLGIGGLAVALAARSTLENIISGFILFADKPLAVGDFCRFGDRIGTVERIGIRSTSLRTLDRTLVAVPNADFVTLHLENYGKRDRMLMHKTFRLRYETTPDQLRFVLAELRRLLIAHPKVTEDPARVRLVAFGDDALEIEVFAYVQSTDWSEFLAIREDIYLRMMEVVAGSGTGFALPSQTLYVGRDGGIDGGATARAEAAVDGWRKERRLPFPNFSGEEIARTASTLAYPPEGAPDVASQVADGQMKAHRARRSFWSFARGPRPGGTGG
ncbi:mechanosensitive ion channel family protein [Amorphus sp. MBR-141]